MGKFLTLAFLPENLGVVQFDPRRKPKVEAGEVWLRGYLKGGSRPWPEVEADGRQAGLSETTLRRAGERIGVMRESGNWSLAK